jgi:hypothetical protein
MSGINANVSLTLAELDELRNKIAQGDRRINEQALEIAKFQSEQPQVKVTLRQRFVNSGIEQTIRNIAVRVGDAKTISYGGSNGYSYNKYNQWGKMADHEIIGYRDEIHYEEVTRAGDVEKIEYINLDVIKKDMFESAKQEVGDTITKLNNSVTNLINQKSELESKTYSDRAATDIAHKKELSKLNDDFEQKLVEVSEGYESEIKELSNEIKIMKGDEVEKTKDKLIEDLKKEIAELKTPKKKSIFGW